jgi:hypothetical protein
VGLALRILPNVTIVNERDPSPGDALGDPRGGRVSRKVVSRVVTLDRPGIL